ncbi:MAG: 50S ribosomal protein L23 [Planctomycetota bacterium]|nr:50S ribosomal protein L23 [Planctomycetota bacterium]
MKKLRAVPVMAPRLHLEPHQVILRPLLTEKGVHRSSRYGQYSFEINPLATKDDVKIAMQFLFDVTVTKVCTQTRKGKPRKHRYRFGYTKAWKKAIVTLGEGQSLEFI